MTLVAGHNKLVFAAEEQSGSSFLSIGRHHAGRVKSIFNGKQAMLKALIPPEPSQALHEPPTRVESIAEPFRSSYKENPQNYSHILKFFELVGKKLKRQPEFADLYAIIDALRNANGSTLCRP